MISFKQTHANENNLYNKPFTVQIEHIFKCSLKTKHFIKIKHYLQRISKTVGFIAIKYKKCLFVHYQKQLTNIKFKLTKGKYYQDIVIKK